MVKGVGFLSALYLSECRQHGIATRQSAPCFHAPDSVPATIGIYGHTVGSNGESMSQPALIFFGFTESILRGLASILKLRIVAV